MNWLQFLSSVIQSLAWPAVVLIVVLMLKDSIAALIPRLKRFKHKDTELEFEEKVREIEAQVAPVTKNLPARTGNPSDRVSQIDRLYDIVDISPRAAIVEAWIQVESALSKVASKVEGFDKNWRSIPPTTLLNILRDRGLIEERIFDGLQQMRTLRNRAAHSEDFALSAEGVRKFLELSKNVISTFEKQSEP